MLDYFHTLTLPTPFAVGPINVYLAEGDDLALIDTGPNDPATLAALRAQLGARSVSFKDIRRIVITHAHPDHYGLAAQIVAESGARVFSHSRNRGWLTDFENERSHRYDFYRDVFTRSGAPREFADEVLKAMRGSIQYAASIPADRFAPLDDGDMIPLGGDKWQVVFAPGHASGLICLYEPQSRTLVSSDHLLRDITSNPVLEPPLRGERERPRALVDYMAALEKTARLDIRIALPAHGEPVYDVRALVDARLAFHRSRLDYIEQQLECCATTAYELCNILFPNLKSMEVFLGLSEVIGHLDVLEAEGRIKKAQSDGVVRYTPVSRN